MEILTNDNVDAIKQTKGALFLLMLLLHAEMISATDNGAKGKFFIVTNPANQFC